jgi:hypothetical protein
LWLYVSFAKLFKFFSQQYCDAREWIHDVLKVAAISFDDEESVRLLFAQSIRSIINRYDSVPFRSIDAEIRKFEQYWNTDAFVVAVYAVWKTAHENRLQNGAIKTVAAHLKRNASFIDPKEFDLFIV